jgi:hypothetical protein
VPASAELQTHQQPKGGNERQPDVLNMIKEQFISHCVCQHLKRISETIESVCGKQKAHDLKFRCFYFPPEYQKYEHQQKAAEYQKNTDIEDLYLHITILQV